MDRRMTAAVACALALACPSLGQEKKAEPPKKPEMPKTVQDAGKAAKDAMKGAQDAAKGQMDDMMKAYMDAAKPGAFHEWMKRFEGEWKTSHTLYDEKGAAMGPATPGEMTYEMQFGGRYVEMEYESSFMGQPFMGAGTLAYNNIDKRFESTWYDSMSTGITMMTGQADKEGKVLTMTGEASEPDGTKYQMKEVMTLVSADEHRSDFFRVIDGKDVKVMDIVYKRSKSEAKTGADKGHGK